MKIVHVLRGDYQDHVGGDLRQLWSSVEALTSLGLSAEARTINDLPRGAEVVHLYNLQLPIALTKSMRFVRRALPEASLVLSPIYWPADRRAVSRARGVSRPVRVLQELGPRRRFHWVLARAALVGADAVLPNSTLEVHRLVHHFRVSADDRWMAVPNGVSARAAPVRSRCVGQDLHIACVARLEPQKNQCALIRAVQSLQNVDLTLVGPVGEARYAHRVRADLVELGDRARWIPFLPPDSLWSFLGTVDIHVLPSYRETPGLASLEAALAGCEVVVTREGSTEEYFGDLAHYADPRSAESIAAAVLSASRLSHQPRLANHVRQFNWQSVAQQLASIYKHLVSAHAPNRSV